jgi:hypothetical protein
MQELSITLSRIVNEASEKFRKMSDGDWNFRKSPEKWTKKEILGHLIDSAANNHQRFVRAQYGDKTPISYAGDSWVKTQDYKSAEIKILIGLWVNYNLHLVYVISKIPADKYKVLFNADAKEPVTLKWMIKDYVRHLEHHLTQILS